MKAQILVPLHTYPEGNDERLALHAAALARHLQGAVHAVVLAADFPDVSSPFGTMLIDVPGMTEEVRTKCRARGRALVRAFEAALAAAEIGFVKSEAECLPALFGDLVAERARYHDFVLVGIGASRAARATAEAVIFGSGRPVIVAPEAGAPASFDHVMIAWDGSGVAARAVNDARDFIDRAKTVTIVTVTDEKSLPADRPAERLAAYLACRGIRTELAAVRNAGHTIGETLQLHARNAGAGLIVMGAYGHSRLREFVLGGATAGILGDLQTTALLSH
jgi:nucleotide-binding universal stress UspA family protein